MSILMAGGERAILAVFQPCCANVLVLHIRFIYRGVNTMCVSMADSLCKHAAVWIMSQKRKLSRS